MKAPAGKKRAEPPAESDALAGAPHPRHTSQFFGNQEAERALLSAYRSNRLPHAWIIGGRQGIGKATLAWRMAKFLLANPDSNNRFVQTAQDLSVRSDQPIMRLISQMSAPDLALLRREWNEKTGKFFTEIRVDDARRTLHMFHQNAASGGWRICIVDAADDLNRASANALLKLIEEPPEKSLFLLVAHQPGRLLPTIRSRCRKLFLAPLAEREIAAAVHSLGGVWADFRTADVAKAAHGADGSVRETLRILDRQGAVSARRAADVLAHLPRLDWSAAQTLVDDLSKPQNGDEYEAFLEMLFQWLDRRIRENAAHSSWRLQPYADVWEKIWQGARDVDVYNLDKRPFIMAVFEDLSQAAALAARK